MTATQTHAKVRQAALELFAEKGFAGTGIRELADRVGVTTAALYHYMGTKDDLLLEMMRSSMKGVVDGGERIAVELSAPAARIAALVQFHVQMHALRRLETTVLDTELRALAPAARAEIIALRDLYDGIWAQSLQQGIADDVFHDVHPHEARLALMEMCTGVKNWFSPEGEHTPEELGCRFADMALSLLNARDGDRPIRLQSLLLPEPSWFSELAMSESPVGGDSSSGSLNLQGRTRTAS